jgi:hypothetical protein
MGATIVKNFEGNKIPCLKVLIVAPVRAFLFLLSPTESVDTLRTDLSIG